MLRTVDERLRRLRDYELCEQTVWRGEAAWAVLSAGGSRSCAAFAEEFVQQGMAEGIPLHVVEVKPDDGAVSVVTQYGLFLPRPDWEIVGRIGYAAMRTVPGIYVAWGGDGSALLSDGGQPGTTADRPHWWVVGPDKPPRIGPPTLGEMNTDRDVTNEWLDRYVDALLDRGWKPD